MELEKVIHKLLDYANLLPECDLMDTERDCFRIATRYGTKAIKGYVLIDQLVLGLGNKYTYEQILLNDVDDEDKELIKKFVNISRNSLKEFGLSNKDSQKMVQEELKEMGVYLEKEKKKEEKDNIIIITN